MSETSRIAVIGGGVAGITAAYILQKKHQVSLCEKNDYVGGHTNTIVIEYGPDAGTPVDTGFIVCNDKTYPHFHRLLRRLNVPWRWSDMSFGFYDERTQLQYAGANLDGLFAQRSNLLNPSFLGMLADIRRFSKLGIRDLERGGLEEISLGEYLKMNRFGGYFARNYLLPMGAAIWSTPTRKMLRFPAATFLRFFKNHGLLSLKDRPRWQTVVGGSQSYVQAFLKSFKGEVCKNTKLAGVRRENDGVTLRFEDGSSRQFDKVIFAVHADEVLPLLEDPTPDEKRLFGVWQYERNRVVLHTDEDVLPPNRRAWASWNFTREASAGKGSKLSMTYLMNRLQGLDTPRQYCVSLNRVGAIREESIIREIDYTHPLYTRSSLCTQAALSELNGQNNSYYCGSYFGYGFHEDAVKSSVQVGSLFGLKL